MTLFQFATGITLLIAWIIRPLLYKPIAEFFPSKYSSTFTSFYLVLSLILTYPFLGHLYIFNNQNALLSPYILISVIKGIFLFYCIMLLQKITRKSLSSSVFMGFIAMALSCFVNNLFFDENLGILKTICICGFGILSLIFLHFGDGKRLSKRGMIFFFVTAIIMALFSISDHLAIPQVGWYAHLSISSIAMFLICLIYKKSRDAFKMVIKNKQIIYAGAFYTLSEYLVIYTSINILPVSIVSMFLRLSVLVVMIISAIKYKEQDLKNQMIFGGIALLLAIPILL